MSPFILADIDGNVFVESHDKDTIVFLFEKWNKKRMSPKVERYFKKIQPDIHFSDNKLEIEIRYPSSNVFSWFGSAYRHIRVESRLLVPAQCSLRIKTIDGNMEIKTVSGKIELKTIDGNVSVSDLKDSITIRTIDGNITAQDIKGDIYMKTVDGNFNINKYNGKLQTNSTDGNLKLKDGNGSLSASTTDGDIDVSGVFSNLQSRTIDGDAHCVVYPRSKMEGDWKFSSSDGSIQLDISDDMAFNLNIKTGDGRISASKLQMDNVSHKKKNRLSGSRGNGQNTIFITTGDGSVRMGNTQKNR